MPSGLIRPTFRAITVFVGMCLTLLTVPPLPAPRSLMISRSSGFRSKLNSMPISSCAALSSPFPLAGPGRAFSAVGGGFGAGAFSARPLTFLRFMERGAKASAMAGNSARSRRWSGGSVWVVGGMSRQDSEKPLQSLVIARGRSNSRMEQGGSVTTEGFGVGPSGGFGELQISRQGRGRGSV